MSSHTLTTILPMNADLFYKITETSEFDHFQIPYLGLASHELKEEREEESHIYRKVCIKPKTSIPKILLKFANNEELSYTDVQIKSKTKKEISFKTQAPILAEHIHVDGIITVEALDDQTCLKVLKVTFRFTGPLQWFSSIIENSILSELKKTIELLPTIVNDYKKHLAAQAVEAPAAETNTSAADPIQISSQPHNSSGNRSSISPSKDSPAGNMVNKEPVAQYV
ncbi:hypothetical protein CYY_007689 [Polysphondylium violaceum]|uniref:Uncharacterized protein n=1 Tax=Polysphondylium violaceum TaxID=133409 RepID=A0A8J4V4Q2_9MYCE|nr:hypothetical protein CYY_007689 [Polysphondylium violaceum]